MSQFGGSRKIDGQTVGREIAMATFPKGRETIGALTVDLGCESPEQVCELGLRLFKRLLLNESNGIEVACKRGESYAPFRPTDVDNAWREGLREAEANRPLPDSAALVLELDCVLLLREVVALAELPSLNDAVFAGVNGQSFIWHRYEAKRGAAASSKRSGL